MRSINLNHQPVIIIGAPRSGTKMLRNIISSFEDFGTWPFDEINFIWRHGHKISESDEFPVSTVDEGKANYVRRQFNKVSLIGDSMFLGITLSIRSSNDLILKRLSIFFISDSLSPTCRFIKSDLLFAIIFICETSFN